MGGGDLVQEQRLGCHKARPRATGHFAEFHVSSVASANRVLICAAMYLLFPDGADCFVTPPSSNSIRGVFRVSAPTPRPYCTAKVCRYHRKRSTQRTLATRRRLFQVIEKRPVEHPNTPPDQSSSQCFSLLKEVSDPMHSTQDNR